MNLPRQILGGSHAAGQRGFLMLLALIFGAIFLGLLASLSGFILSENRDENVSISNSKAFALAEAGVEYYRWHLAEFPNDLQDGTGHAGPYTMTYDDPEGGSVGTITLTISGNAECGQLTSVNIQSSGAPSDGTGGTATIQALWAKPSVALYSYILNSSVWAGADRIINGPYHSNGGIRMDGTVNAPVTSSLASWTCTTTFGCGTNTTENGVFGAGTNTNLWSYPTPQVDFNAISANFSSLKSTANASGLYFPRVSSGTTGSNAGEGYHLIFNSNGTVTVYKVTSETNVPSFPVDNSSVGSPQPDYTLINNQSLYNNGPHPTGVYTIPSTCGLIFVEDNTWIEGAIPSEVTVVAANVTTSGITPNIMLPNNITYTSPSGTSGLTAISANDILITPNSPTNMNISGVFIAQGGAFGRNDYGFNSSGSTITCPNSYEPRGTLTIHGTTVSNLRTGTQWSNSCNSGNAEAGYQTRIDAFDRQLSTSPPPFTPAVSTTGEIVNWRQTQ